MSIPQQFSQITDQLARLSRSLEELKQRWEQESMNCQTELRQTRALNEVLQAQNKELEACLAQRPDNDTLELARQTLGEFLREDIIRANARFADARDHDLISNPDIDAQEYQRSSDTSLQTEQGRDKTVAPGTEVVTNEENIHDLASSSRPASPLRFSTGSGLPNLSPKSVKEHHHKGECLASISGTLPSELLPETDSFPVQPTSPSSNGSNGKSWKIQIHKPPVSARVKCGPMKWSKLASKLGLDEDTVTSLKRSLLSNVNLGLAVQIHGDLAFVYNPIFLDDISTPVTYLFDWGREEENGNISHYLLEKGKLNGSVFHTFVYILKPKRWYYVGSQKWTQTSLEWEIWSTLREQDRSRSKVLQHLEDHCGHKINREEIVELLDDGALKQICFTLSGDDHIDASREMCIAMDYTSPAS